MGSRLAPVDTKNDLTLRGRVNRLFYSSPEYSAGRFLTDEGQLVSFAGKIPTRVGQQVILVGQWTTHPKYGRQFEVSSIQLDRQMDAKGLANYLANDPDIKQIGPVRARLIAEQFGANFEHTLMEHPEAIADIAKVPVSVIEALRDRWQESAHVNATMTALSAYGLTHHQATKLVQKFGAGAVGIIEEDPYILSGEIDGFGFKRVDAIARAVGIDKTNPNRIRAGVQFCVEDALDQGDCWIDYETLLDTANKLLILDTLDSRDLIEQQLDALINEKKLFCHHSDSRFLVALPSIWEMERYLLDAFEGGSAPSPAFEAKVTLDEVMELSPQLNDEQRNAVMRAASHTLSLISGGAGSGKTFTVAAITKLCEANNVPVMLCAPTGKAAKRMEQSTGIEALTIHRLLGFNGREWTYSSDYPLPGGMLIVDEVSMMDVPLAWHLFQAIDLDNTAVVLVGDHNQLPPVGPGNVLRDLIESRAIPTTILDSIVRQAGVLKENSVAILRGDVRRQASSNRASAETREPWYVADQYSDVDRAQAFVLRLFDEALERMGFDILRDVQLLTPTHKGPIGCAELNVKLQQLFQRKLWHREAEPVEPKKRPKLMTNDKVIQTKNDYKLGVMNGATGIVREILNDGTLVIDFDSDRVTIPSDSDGRKNIQLAYALTIHKAQGSEYPCSIVVVHKSHSFMHHRNLLYTGVTRASQTAIIVGDHWGIANCAKKVQVDARKTFLSLLLPHGEATPQ